MSFLDMLYQVIQATKVKPTVVELANIQAQQRECHVLKHMVLVASTIASYFHMLAQTPNTHTHITL